MYASLVIIAANAGGAFSPIGDVTTIMLWNANMITAGGVISEILVPSVVALVIPGLIMQTMLKGELVTPEEVAAPEEEINDFSEKQRKVVFFVGVGGLIFVPIFKTLTHLPPFVGVLLVLGAAAVICFDIEMPWAYYAIGFILSFMCTVGLRFSYRIVRQVLNELADGRPKSKKERIMIIGAG